LQGGAAVYDDRAIVEAQAKQAAAAIGLLHAGFTVILGFGSKIRFFDTCGLGDPGKDKTNKWKEEMLFHDE
jgi:hypothetical protein